MEKATEILKKYWGYDAFRTPQDTVIQLVMQGKDVLALMPTGGGKSVTFQVPALLKEGICIVVSPLIALMTDQVESLKSKRIRALSLAGNLPYNDLERLLSNALYGDYKFLYLSPERLQQPVVQEFIKQMNVNLIAIDEAHCVSHWGKDFRPAYLQCTCLKEFFPNVPMLALTASATPKVQQDIVNQLLMKNVALVSSSLKRPNISYLVMKTHEKWQQLERILRQNKGTSIVYMRSRNGTLRMAEYLSERGISAAFFHGGLSSQEKDNTLKMWMLDKVQVMVATNAFGMGIDKSSVRNVIHWDIPTTIEDYFQEAGRGGRDGQKSQAVLLYDDYDLQSAKNQLVENLVDVPFLKILYSKLNAHFKIAYGEGYGIPYYLQFSEFCKKYTLDTNKVYNGLQLLDRLSVISLNLTSHRKSTLFFLLPNTQLIEYLKNNQSAKDVTFYILRSYPGIYQTPIAIDIERIAKKTKVEVSEIYQILEKLKADGVVEFNHQNADTEIIFNVMRDDDRTIDAIAKNVKEHNKNKIFLQKSMFDYVENDVECKSVQLLRYFGEKNIEPCGTCSVCISKVKQKLENVKEIENQIVTLLSERNVSLSEMNVLLPFHQEQIQKVLFNMLEMSIIEINHLNEFSLKKSYS